MTALDSFDKPAELLQWADEAVSDLKVEIKAFFSPDAGSFVAESDPQARELVLKFVFRKKIPSTIRRRATEALNNIRHSFDQSLYAACRVLRQPSEINFPWRTNPKDLARFLESKHVPRELWDDIFRHEPYFTGEGYAGGDNYIRKLAQLANGKHTVGLGVRGEVVGFVWPDVTYSGPFARVALTMPRWDPVKNEIVYARVPLGASLQDNERVKLHIVLDEPGLLQGKPLVASLELLLKKAHTVHNDFKATCARATGL